MNIWEKIRWNTKLTKAANSQYFGEDLYTLSVRLSGLVIPHLSTSCPQ